MADRKIYLQNFTLIRNLLKKFLWILKYKIFNYLFLESYYSASTVIKRSNGIANIKRETLVIVSLTTIIERIDRVYLTIETLLQQSVKPDHLILWLSETDFSIDYLKDRNRYTRRLLKLRSRGLTINFCKDIRSYTKIVPTLKQYPNAIVISADDDLYYPKNWLNELYSSYLDNPKVVHCQMAYSMRKASNNKLLPFYKWLKPGDKFQGPSFNIFPFTGQGCLFPPGSLHKEVFNEEVFLQISPSHDDAWFKAMSLLNGFKVKKIKPISKHCQTVRGTGKKTLTSILFGQKQFDPQVEVIFSKNNLYKLLEDIDPN